MLVAKQVADVITWARASLAVVLAWLGVAEGARALPLACWLMLVDWMGDLLDGPIARRSRAHYHTWIGEHDLQVDMAVAVGLLVYLVAGGLVDPRLAGVYVLVWALVFWRWGVPKSLGMLAQAPVYGWFLAVSVRDAPAAGLWLVGWILAVIVLTWPRFPREVIPGFLSGMRQVGEQYRRDRG